MSIIFFLLLLSGWFNNTRGNKTRALFSLCISRLWFDKRIIKTCSPSTIRVTEILFSSSSGRLLWRTDKRINNAIMNSHCSGIEATMSVRLICFVELQSMFRTSCFSLFRMVTSISFSLCLASLILDLLLLSVLLMWSDMLVIHTVKSNTLCSLVRKICVGNTNNKIPVVRRYCQRRRCWYVVILVESRYSLRFYPCRFYSCCCCYQCGSIMLVQVEHLRRWC